MEVIEPLGHHELLIVLVQLTLLLFVARVLGEALSSVGQPAVIGELLAGVVLGPSLLGFVAPGVYDAVFAVSESQFHLLEAISWIGLIMLLIVTGLETDIDLILNKGQTALVLSLGGVVVPFATGFLLGWFLPVAFIAAASERLVFSLFLATAMSISAIPVIAKVLIELDVIRRDIGQLILAAGMVDDTIGWILLATVAGLARTGVFDLEGVATTVVSVVIFLVVAFTVGQQAIALLIRWVDNTVGSDIALLSTLMLSALAAGAVTQYIGLEAILGAFVVGVLVGQVERFDYEVQQTFEKMTLSVFAPLFFALAGLRMDVVALLDPTVLGVGVIVFAVACFGKFGGILAVSGFVGLSRWEGVTIGGGMNARGAMEIIVATIGLGLGILTTSMYSIIVAIAILTSLMAPAVMRWSLPKIELGTDERRRIERERYLQDSFVNNLNRVLLVTRGSIDTQYAARLVGPLLRRQQVDLDVLEIGGVNGETTTEGLLGRGRRFFADRFRRGPGTGATSRDASGERESIFTQVTAGLGTQQGSVRRLLADVDDTVAETILGHATAGYDLVILGEQTFGEDMRQQFYSATIDRVIQEAPCPVMVVSASGTVEPGAEWGDEPIERLLVPTVGSRSSRYATEAAFTIGIAEDALVDIAHVVTNPHVGDQFAGEPNLSQELDIADLIVDREAQLGRELGASTISTVTVADTPGEALVDIADRTDCDAIVMGSTTRPLTRRAVLGPNVGYIIRNAPCPVAVLAYS